MGFYGILRELLSGGIEPGSGKSPINGRGHWKITYFYGPFSSKPCLITGGYDLRFLFAKLQMYWLKVVASTYESVFVKKKRHELFPPSV